MRKLYILSVLFLCSFYTFAQKKPLDHSVYDEWQSVSSEKISDDGQWVGYAVTPQAGDANLFIKNLKKKERQFTYPRVTSFDFSEDGSYAAFLIKPYYQDTRQAKIKKRKSDEMPKDSLGVLKLSDRSLVKIPRVKSYAFPEKASNVIAYLLDKEPADTSARRKPAAKEDADYFFADESPAPVVLKEGTNLVLKNFDNQTETIFKGVTDYQLSANGTYLLYVCSGIKKDSSVVAGVILYDVKSNTSKSLTNGKGIYKNLSFDEKASQLAFTGNKSPEKALLKIHDLYYYGFKTDSAYQLINSESDGMPKGFSVSENGKVYFSKTGNRLFFGTAPTPTPKDTTIVDFEVAKVDIWNYKDDDLQSMQLANLNRKLKESFVAMVDLKKPDHLLQIGTEEVNDIDIVDDGDAKYALGSTDYRKRVALQWEGGTLKAAYIINMETGERRLINDYTKTSYQLSPKAKYVTWFDRKDQNWYAFNIATGKKVLFIHPRQLKFGDEDNDVPDDPSSYGYANFTDDDQLILVNDRYDIWSFNPETGAGEDLTSGYGRLNKITFRYARLDPEKKSISPKETILLSAFNNMTKQNGWYEKNMANTKAPVKLVMADYSFSRPRKAKNSDLLIYEKGNYQHSPDLYVSTDFIKERQLSAINPQQNDYNWGTAGLVHWTTPKGHHSDGILYKPENFDPTRKYPMIVYFYEKLSDGLYNYQPPAPTPSRLNISYFVSNGYLVFTPDISYEVGHPGKSAEEFINSGVEALKLNSWVDGTKIGIQGQSWGGYQVAHLITVTNRYAAAWAGAPVVDMFSAYGGIRWQSGMNRQFQYEKTQSRIGATIWEKPELYIENSPLFKMPDVQTPVAIMANDADGSVPWYQGIEMFTALRRLGKPAWLLVYNGEDHNLVQRQNRKDISIREQQFFDHFLKGAPMPEWMEKGVPATEKGKDWGFALSEDH